MAWTRIVCFASLDHGPIQRDCAAKEQTSIGAACCGFFCFVERLCSGPYQLSCIVKGIRRVHYNRKKQLTDARQLPIEGMVELSVGRSTMPIVSDTSQLQPEYAQSIRSIECVGQFFLFARCLQ